MANFLTIGMRSVEVATLQRNLNALGERLKEDGAYGQKTAEAVQRFQSANGIAIDGVAGTITQAKITQQVGFRQPFSKPAMPVIEEDKVSTPDDTEIEITGQVVKSAEVTSEPSTQVAVSAELSLPDDQYVKEETAKTIIVLHHTEGATAGSSIEYWKSTSERVATAFVIERDGTIYQCFDPKYWAWHLGSGKMLKISQSQAQKVNSSSIGIELANEGELEEKDGKLYCFGKEYIARPWGFGFNDVIRQEWRDGKIWAAYPQPQQDAAIRLSKSLCTNFSIPFKLIGGLDYDKSVMGKSGIFCHCSCRTDKLDLHPGFNLDAIPK